MVKIYGLICPVSKKIRYIGKTSKSLKQRLKQHLSETKQTTYKQKWIKSLKDKNLYPEIVLINNVLESDWIEKERFYIKLFKDCGFKLTNISEGGEGGGSKGYTHTEKWKKEASERMLKRMKDNPFSKEYYQKLNGRKRKKIVSTDKFGNKKEYISISESAKELVHLQKNNSLKQTCTAISNCLNKRSKTAYGYSWNYL